MIIYPIFIYVNIKFEKIIYKLQLTLRADTIVYMQDSILCEKTE